MEFRGTPGPWFIKPVSKATVDGDLFIIQTNNADGKGYHIAYASTWGDNEESAKEAMNNANLIIAAPALLEALQDMQGINRLDMEGQALVFRKARAAIAKAIGKEE